MQVYGLGFIRVKGLDFAGKDREPPVAEEVHAISIEFIRKLIVL